MKLYWIKNSGFAFRPGPGLKMWSWPSWIMVPSGLHTPAKHPSAVYPTSCSPGCPLTSTSKHLVNEIMKVPISGINSYGQSSNRGTGSCKIMWRSSRTMLRMCEERVCALFLEEGPTGNRRQVGKVGESLYKSGLIPVLNINLIGHFSLLMCHQ